MKIINIATSIFLIVLAGDLLYLYYTGAWYDPSKIIEITEVVFLYILIVLGITGLILNMKGGK